MEVKLNYNPCCFSSHVRHQRRRPMTREAGREKETSMTAIARVSLIYLPRQKHLSIQGCTFGLGLLWFAILLLC